MLAEVLLSSFKELGFEDFEIEEWGLTRRNSYVYARGYLGFAFLPESEPLCCVPKTITEALALAWKGTAETSLALASMFLLTNMWIDKGGKVNFVEKALPFELEGKVIMVGYMEGVAKAIKGEVVVYEDSYILRCRAKELGFKAYPGSYLLLEKEADAVIATGASLLDPRILHVQRIRAEKKILMGPTASVLPFVASSLGFTHVAGSYVEKDKRKEVMEKIKAGYGYKRLSREKVVKKWYYEVYS